MNASLRSLRAWAVAWLASPRAPLHAALIALLIGLPALGLGEMLDDHFLRVSLLGDPAYAFLQKPPLDVFRLFDGDPARTMRMVDRGLAPWWTDPHLRIAFFRPLTAATHLLDFKVAGDSAWWMHVHSLLYYALATGMAGLVFRRVLGPGKAAGLAALLFAIDATHGMLVGWIANRNQLIASALALAALAVFLKHAEDAPRRAANVVLGPVLLGLGLCGGEAALGVLGYFVAHALVLDARPLTARLGAMAPYLVVTLGWACFYRASGYGTAGSGFYHDPIRAPLAYLTAVVQHLPMLALNELIGFPADLFVSLSEHARTVFASSAVVLGLCIGSILMPTLRHDPKARFFGLAGSLALLPVCATEPSARLLLLPGVGLLGLATRFVLATRAGGSAAPRAARVYAGYFLARTWRCRSRCSTSPHDSSASSKTWWQTSPKASTQRHTWPPHA